MFGSVSLIRREGLGFSIKEEGLASGGRDSVTPP